MSLVKKFNKQVVKMTPEQRSVLIAAMEEANEADYQRILFGVKKPTIAGLRKYLREHSGDKMSDYDRVTIVRAINCFRRKFGAVLVIEKKDGEKVRCTLSTDKRDTRGNTYPPRFRVVTSGKIRTKIYGRNALPELFLENI